VNFQVVFVEVWEHRQKSGGKRSNICGQSCASDAQTRNTHKTTREILNPVFLLSYQELETGKVKKNMIRNKDIGIHSISLGWLHRGIRGRIEIEQKSINMH
jgi:hypothetical protein